MTAPGCDAPGGGAYPTPDGRGGVQVRCRCLVCPRCERHTGNSTHGHASQFCKVARTMVAKRHFCCPGDCELWP